MTASQQKQEELLRLREERLRLEAEERDNASLLAWLDTLLDLGGDLALSLKTEEGVKATADARRRIDIRARLDSLEKLISMAEEAAALEADEGAGADIAESEEEREE